LPLDPYAKRILDMLGTAGMSEVSRSGVQEMREGFFAAGANGRRYVPIGRVEVSQLTGAAHALPIRIYTLINTSLSVRPKSS
jgi:hypothetical protein